LRNSIQKRGNISFLGAAAALLITFALFAPAVSGAALYLRQPSGPIFKVPAQAGYGDKWPS